MNASKVQTVATESAIARACRLAKLVSEHLESAHPDLARRLRDLRVDAFGTRRMLLETIVRRLSPNKAATSLNADTLALVKETDDALIACEGEVNEANERLVTNPPRIPRRISTGFHGDDR